MIICGLVLDSEALRFITFSCIFGIILLLIIIKLSWEKIREKFTLLMIGMFFLFVPFVVCFLMIFAVLPPVLDSYIIVEPAKEYKVEIVKKEFKKGSKGESTRINKRGKKETVYKYEIGDEYNLHLKKWYKSSNDKETITVDLPKEKFDNYKENQLVFLKSYKGFLGFRHIIIDDNTLKPVEEESTSDKKEQLSNSEKTTN